MLVRLGDEPGVLLDAATCAHLVRWLAEGLRVAQRRGDAVTPDDWALLEKLEQLARAHRASTGVPVPPVPQSADSDDVADNGLTTEAAARRMGVTPGYVRRLIRTGQLDAVKVKGSWRVSTNGTSN
jgi:excisionase family DNA binding protein